MRIAIITGASSGMGKEFVRQTLEKGEQYDELWLIARRKQRLAVWEKRYRKQKFRLLPLDLLKEQDMQTLYSTLKTADPRIGLLVHCAGFGVMGSISEIPLEEQTEMVDINCRSLVELTKILLPYMESGARMIYLASAAAFLPQPGFAVYAASKAFTLSFVRALRRELAPRRIQVTAVCPGAVRTEFFNRAARHKSLPAYKRLVMADPQKVVSKAIRDAEAGKELSVYGPAMQAFFLAAKLLPHRLILRFL